jgi:glycosyltransferase involved in cell wall biosynthesis
VRIALVTTPPSVRSGIGDYTRHLLPYLRALCSVDVFVHEGQGEEGWAGEEARLASTLDPRSYDQVLYQLGNEQAHAFMPRMIRSIGGTVAQHDWVLFDMATSAWPALARGGPKGHALAMREGGLSQAGVYLGNWIERRRQRQRRERPLSTEGLEGSLLFGWHAFEGGTRWTSDFAGLRIPAQDVKRVRIEIHPTPGRRLRVLAGDRALGEGDGDCLDVHMAPSARPELVLMTTGVKVTVDQRRHGDTRRLGSAVRRVTWEDSSGEHELDLAGPCASAPTTVQLSRDRFRLALNRSVVRFADAFLVHSRYVRDRIRAERGDHVPIGVLHHGSEERWRDGERRETRRDLGLPAHWVDSCLVVSFGGVQAHKRIDKVLEGLALARKQRGDLRLVLAGSLNSGDFDPHRMVERLGLADAVRFTGYLTEEQAWGWLHASDFAINLRGPTTGGTSGGIFQAFSVGRSVIVSDAAEQRELPRDCVVPVPLGPDEVAVLARELVRLRDHPGRRDQLEASVRQFVREHCHWSLVARKYADHLASFPRARASRRGLIAMRIALQRSALA